MKMKEPHVVPLSPPAIALMRRLRDAHVSLEGATSANGLVFTGAKD